MTDFTEYQGRPLDFFDRFLPGALLDWQRQVIGETLAVGDDGKALYETAAWSTPRRCGKSTALAAVGLYRLLCYPADVLTVSHSVEGARVIIRVARQLLARSPALSRAVTFRRDRFELKGTPFQWAILSSSATIQRGQGAATLLLDEAGWLDPREELYETLSPMLASAGQPPLAVLASTVGRRNSPLATVQKLAAEDVPKVYSYYTDDYRINPYIDAGYVERERKRLPPILFMREWENRLGEGIDLLADREKIEAAFKSGWGPQSHGQPDVSYYLYYDGATVGLASAAIVHMDADGVLYADEIHTWKGGRTRIDTDAVRRYLEDAFRRYPIRKARLESYQSLALEQALSKLGYPVEFHAPTAQSMTTLWTTLQSVLSNNRLRLFREGPGRQLREELENAVTEPTATGIKVSGSPHPDVAVSLGGACVLAIERARQPVTEFGFAGMLSGAYGAPPAPPVNADDPGFSFPGMDDQGSFYHERYPDAAKSPPSWELEEDSDVVERRALRRLEPEEQEYVDECLAGWPENKPYLLTMMSGGVRLLHHRDCPNIGAVLLAFGKGQIEDLIPLTPVLAAGVRERHSCCPPMEEPSDA